MKIEWTSQTEQQTTLKKELKEKGFSKRLLAKIKFQGGFLQVNDVPATVKMPVEKGDHICVTLPEEKGNEYLVPSYEPINILYEDEHILVVDKPVGVVSVPSPARSEGTMANRVKGYIEQQGYEHQNIHVVTRLDRDTTGVMLFAKHSMAHSLLDKQLQSKQIIKMYKALVEGSWIKEEHGVIDLPIARSEESIILRKVAPEGKKALTEYWVNQRYDHSTLVDVQLHTGRTHQIRVHFSHLGHPLVGDDMYGGSLVPALERQALHCASLSFTHPFSGEELHIASPFPSDIAQFLEQQEKGLA